MAVWTPDDFVQGSDGQWYSPNAEPPPGVTLSGIPKPTMTAPPGSAGGPQLSTPQGGQLATRPITTPDSSTGAPRFQAPSATGWSTEFATPQGGALTTTTPNSRTGAPAPGIRTVPNSMLPVGGGLMTGGGALTAIPTPTPEQMTNTLNNPPMADDPWGIKAISKMFGYGGQAATAPVTQTGPGRSPSGPAPPPPAPPVAPPGPPSGSVPPPPPPPGNLPPFARGPVPYPMPTAARAPAARAPQNINLGYGAPGVTPAAPSPMFTTIDRPNADIAGGRSVAGQLAPQFFTPAYEPGGPARMGALDLSGLFSHPAVAAAAAQHPAVQGALAAPNMNDAMLGMQLQGAGGGRSARAPVFQQKWSLPQTRPGGAANANPTFWNPDYGVGANVGMGN